MLQARARVRATEARGELVAIAVTVVLLVGTAAAARLAQLPELYAVTALLTWFLGSKTGRPSKRRVENSLAAMPRVEVESIYERVTGRPPRQPMRPVKLEGNDDAE